MKVIMLSNDQRAFRQNLIRYISNLKPKTEEIVPVVAIQMNIE